MAGWFYNQYSGSLNRVPTIGEAPYLIPGTGWHELHIPYSSTRDQAIADAKKEYPNGATPGGSLVGNAAQDIIGGVNAGSVLLRVGEVILGIVLIAVGVAKLTGTSNIISTALKVAPK
jgi:hypothetical protein